MPDERAAFFTTGQFAKLCSTTKETLFHYDSLGLLKPARVGENGYRYYAASQFFDFDLIAVLQSAGCSLQEIHAYMTGSHTPSRSSCGKASGSSCWSSRNWKPCAAP